jgi:hypothetical protein
VQECDVGNEGGDEQHVDGQARRAGHEGRDEDGGEAVALVLDGARGHDGGNGAGVGGEQRDEGFAVEADGAHDAVGDERGAGQVAGVFEDPMKRKSSRIWGRKDEHGRDAFPMRRRAERLQPAGGQQRADEIAMRARMSPKPSESGWPMEKTTSKTPMTTTRKSSGPQMRCSRMLSILRVPSTESGRLVAGAAADLRGPGVGAGGVADHGQASGLGARGRFC